jgi:hypothetical protein
MIGKGAISVQSLVITGITGFFIGKNLVMNCEAHKFEALLNQNILK